jgi:hypothetical protein
MKGVGLRKQVLHVVFSQVPLNPRHEASFIQKLGFLLLEPPSLKVRKSMCLQQLSIAAGKLYMWATL